MQLTEQEIIAGLGYEKASVRDTLLNYFENRHSLPLELTYAAIKIVERHGWNDAFLFPHKIGKCPHDEQSLNWCLDEIDKIQTGKATLNSERSTLPFHLVNWVTTAHVDLLQQNRDRIASNQTFLKPLFRDPATPLDKIDRRIEIAALDPQQAWEQLIKHCNGVANVKTFPEAAISSAELLLEPIAEAGDNFRDRMIEILADTESNYQGARGWKVGLMIQLAGRLRCEDSLPLLLSKFSLDWDWYNDQISYAIQAIGTPTIHQAVAEYYQGKPWHTRLYLTSVLENIHYDGAAEKIFPLIASESDDGLRVQLAAAMTAQFDEFSIAPASEIYRENPRDPERMVIIENLYALACIADVDLPKKEAWGRIIESEIQRIRDLDLERLVSPTQRNQTAEPQQNKNAKLNSPSLMRQLDSETSSKKPGRNDPCFCGSGKKYKKCCLREDNQTGLHQK